MDGPQGTDDETYASATQDVAGIERDRLETALPRRRVLQLLGAAAAVPLIGDPNPESPVAATPRHRRRAKHKDDVESAGGKATTLFSDDFRSGFDATGDDWFYFSAGDFAGNDGAETTSSRGLRVSAPEFTSTVPQESGPTSLPGGIDHVKWLVYANRLAGSVPGFAATAGRVLSVSARVSARSFGTAGHPFGNAVTDPDDDLRLGSAALNGIDFESWMVFDLFLTNTRIYAFYERLPFGREQLGNYAAFSFQIPLVKRKPDHEHELSIAYDRAAGTVRWLVDGKERFRVDRIGRRIDRKYMTIDHGGVEEDVEPRQLDFGMGLFTLLDGRLPSGEALVRLSSAPDFYFDPAAATPTPLTFVDEESDPGSRLFGQGAELRVRRFAVQSRRTRRHHE